MSMHCNSISVSELDNIVSVNELDKRWCEHDVTVCGDTVYTCAVQMQMQHSICTQARQEKDATQTMLYAYIHTPTHICMRGQDYRSSSSMVRGRRSCVLC